MDILVVGGGAAGMMAAISAAECGHKVTILEKNNKLGKKLFLTGKGRCNLTNACDLEELFANIVTNKKFLYSSLYDFDNSVTIDFFNKIGLKTKIERGNRVFPLSDHSSDVIRVLEKELIKYDVDIKFNTEVIDIITDDLLKDDTDVKAEFDSQDKYAKKKKSKPGYNKIIKGLKLSDGSVIYCDNVIMATGGASYPSTGSDGESFEYINRKGINVIELRPALVPLNTEEKYSHEMSGLSLKNVGVSVVCDGKEIYSGFGEMLFTHFGVSGPLILSASSYLNRNCYGKKANLYIDLKPALTEKNLDERILRDFSEIQNKQFKNSLSALLPSGIIPSVIMLSGIAPEKQVNSITKEERNKIVSVIKKYPLTITSSRKMDEAIITTGGVSIKDINPSTMESRIIKGLYFAGEMIDVDALTGGFNLQIAWSTGHLAGRLGG